MKKCLKIRILLGLLLSLFLLNSAISQVGLTNSGMTQEQERNQASKGFDYGSKSSSALQQLENMTGQKVNTSNANSQRYSQQTVSRPTLSFDQQMNVMVTGMIAQSLISSIFSSNNSAPKVQEAKSHPATLVTNTYGENQKIQNALVLAKHQKMMDLYKLLNEERNMKYKSISDLSMNIKSYQSQEEIERQKLINKGISVTWDYNDPEQVAKEKQLIKERTENPNKWADGIYNSLKTTAPPLPFKKFGELESGDVILFAPKSGDLGGAAVADVSNFGQTSQKSDASHTVTYLKEENGKKVFMDNFPGEGPKIIDEDELRTKYLERDASVAKLVGQPLNAEQATKLYETAKEMETKNIGKIGQGNYWDSTNYGTIGKDNMVCSEASWALIKSTGRELPLSKSWISKSTGVDFSPADFYEQTQYFIVTPLSMSK